MEGEEGEDLETTHGTEGRERPTSHGIQEMDEDSKQAAKKAAAARKRELEIKKRVKSGLGRKDREKKHGGGSNRNKLKGREKSKHVDTKDYDRD